MEEKHVRVHSSSPVAIRKFFAKLPEPRRRHQRITHPLINLIFIALWAMLAGADSFEENGAIG